MRELQDLLHARDKTIKFDHRNNRVRCYPHIINICSSHVIASSTRISKKLLESLKSASDDVLVYSNIDDDDDDDDDVDDVDDHDDDDVGDGDGGNNNNNNNNGDGGDCSFVQDIPELTLDDEHLDIFDDSIQDFYRHLKRDPVKRARRIVRILRSSDTRKRDFRNLIESGNSNGWFKRKNEVLKVPDLELLRDVRTRWDSVYYMIKRLMKLRPVSSYVRLFILFKFDTRTGHRPVFQFGGVPSY